MDQIVSVTTVDYLYIRYQFLQQSVAWMKLSVAHFSVHKYFCFDKSLQYIVKEQANVLTVTQIVIN